MKYGGSRKAVYRSVKRRLKNLAVGSGLYKLNRFLPSYHVLGYHMVADKPHPFYPQISTERFRREIEHLSKNYRVLPLGEIVGRVRAGKPVNGCVAVTFDDGFLDNFLVAYPILKRYKAPATIFLITDCIDTGEAPWFIRFRFAFANCQKKRLRLKLGETFLDERLNEARERWEASEKAMRYLQSCPERERREKLEEIYESLGANNFDELRGMMLDWTEVREMSRNGISFGAHTASHPVLFNLPLTEAENELRTSKSIIEENVESPVVGFAFPFGKKYRHYSSEVVDLLPKCGFEWSVTTNRKANDKNTSLFEINRAAPWELNRG